MRTGYRADLGAAPNLYLDVQRQTNWAASQALTRTARHAVDELRQVMQRVFDRPTPYTLNALRVTPATRDNLTARVDFRQKFTFGTAEREVEAAPAEGEASANPAKTGARGAAKA